MVGISFVQRLGMGVRLRHIDSNKRIKLNAPVQMWPIDEDDTGCGSGCSFTMQPLVIRRRAEVRIAARSHDSGSRSAIF